MGYVGTACSSPECNFLLGQGESSSSILADLKDIERCLESVSEAGKEVLLAYVSSM